MWWLVKAWRKKFQLKHHFLRSHLVVVQSYNTYVQTSDVIQGNDVIMKCDVPSFVTDFVLIVGWEDDSGKVYPSSSVTTQGTQKATENNLSDLYHTSAILSFQLLNKLV